MSITNNWHCDMCGSHWDHQKFIPSELLGFTAERKLAQDQNCYKHICKKCVIAISDAARACEKETYDFDKLNDYYTQERFNESVSAVQ